MSSIQKFNEKVYKVSKKYRQRENIYCEMIKSQCKELKDKLQNWDMNPTQAGEKQPKTFVVHLSLTCFSKDFQELSEKVRMQNLSKKVKIEIQKMQEQKSVLKSQMTFFLTFLRRAIRSLQKNII